MITESNNLTAFTLKLTTDHKKAMKLMCALDTSFKYQYQLLDAALSWAEKNMDELFPIANPKDGEYASCYVSNTINILPTLEEKWNCNPTRALFTSLVHYLKYREDELDPRGTLQPNM